MAQATTIRYLLQTRGSILDDRLTLLTVGGGAAGYFGSIHAKEAGDGIEVAILEKSRPLSKVKISGGGRCNVTTGLKLDALRLSEHYPRGHKELRGTFFRRFGPEETANWFQSRGVALKVESDGRMFPVSNDSSSIIDCLESEAKLLGVTVKTGWNVASIEKLSCGTFKVNRKRPVDQKAEVLYSRFLLLTTGGSVQGHQIAQSLGHSIIEPRPSLFTFQVADTNWTSMNGISFPNVRLRLILPSLPSTPPLNQEGPLLITHWGVSGPAVLRLSAWGARNLFDCHYSGHLLVDFIPTSSEDEVFESLLKTKENNSGKKMKGVLPELVVVPKRFWSYLLNRAGVDEESLWGTCSNKRLREISVSLKKLSLEISGKGAFKEEFVTAGGVPLSEVNMKTMESKKVKGLYFAGEVVNVDGVTGGFNFQNAWSGGYIAGTSIASEAIEELSSLQA